MLCGCRHRGKESGFGFEARPNYRLCRRTTRPLAHPPIASVAMLSEPAPLTTWLEKDGTALALVESLQAQGAEAEEPQLSSKVLLSNAWLCL